MLLPIGKRARLFFHSRSDCSSKTCHCSPLELVRLRCVFTNFTSFSLKFALTTIAGCTISMPLAWQVLQILLTYRGSLARWHTPNDKSPQTLQRATPSEIFQDSPLLLLGYGTLILGRNSIGWWHLEVILWIFNSWNPDLRTPGRGMADHHRDLPGICGCDHSRAGVGISWDWMAWRHHMASHWAN